MLRLMSAVVTVVVVVEAKLWLWRSSVRSSSHGSIALALCLTKYFLGAERVLFDLSVL